MPNSHFRATAGAALLLAAAPLAAQDPGAEAATPESPAATAETAPSAGTVFDDNWLTIARAAR